MSVAAKAAGAMATPASRFMLVVTAFVGLAYALMSEALIVEAAACTLAVGTACVLDTEAVVGDAPSTMK